MQIFVGSAARCSDFGQRSTDSIQPIDCIRTFFCHHGHQAAVVDLMAAIHGILDKFVHTTVRNAQCFLIFGVRSVHAARCFQAVAAHNGHLFNNNDLGSIFSGLCSSSQTGTACTNNDHKSRCIQPGTGQSGFHGFLQRIAGDRCTGNAIHIVAVCSHHGIRQLLTDHRANALCFILLLHGDGVYSSGICCDFHHHIAFHALRRTSCSHSAFCHRCIAATAALIRDKRQRNHCTSKDCCNNAIQHLVLFHDFLLLFSSQRKIFL